MSLPIIEDATRSWLNCSITDSRLDSLICGPGIQHQRWKRNKWEIPFSLVTVGYTSHSIPTTWLVDVLQNYPVHFCLPKSPFEMCACMRLFNVWPHTSPHPQKRDWKACCISLRISHMFPCYPPEGIIYIYICNQIWINHNTSLTWNRRYFPMCPGISYDSTIVI